MPAPPRPSLPSDAPAGRAAPKRRHGGRWIAGLVLVTVLGMWAYIFVYHASGAWRSETPGRMEDPSFGRAAELRCQDTVTAIEALPEAFEAETADDRADVVALVDVELRALLDELDRIPVTGELDRAMVDEWMTDWRRYVADREDYVARLRVDPTARFYVTQSDRDDVQITEAIDRFAAVNQMPSCITPSDVS